MQSALDTAWAQLTAQQRPEHTIASFIGASPAALEVKSHARRVAQNDSTVLLRGETGTGKELLAQAIHAADARGEARKARRHRGPRRSLARRHRPPPWPAGAQPGARRHRTPGGRALARQHPRAAQRARTGRLDDLLQPLPDQVAALRATGGNRLAAAKMLRMSRAALYDRLARYPELDASKP